MLTKAMELQQQLIKICSSVFNEPKECMNDDNTTGKPRVALIPGCPPSKREEIGLRQILMTGYCDCIAKKVPPNSGVFNASGRHVDVVKMSRRKRMTAYMSCDGNVEEPIYIHPQSALYQKVRRDW